MIILAIITICAISLAIYFYCQYHKQEELYGKVSDLKASQKVLRTSYDNYSEKIKEQSNHLAALQSLQKDVENEIRIATAKRESAVALAEKDLELEGEKRRAEFEAKLEKEFEELRANHSLTGYQRLLDQLAAQITEKKKVLEVLQQQRRAAEEKEDFIQTHSLNLNETEKSDIVQLREFAPRLSNKMVLYKLIWSTFYQGKLQALRKELGADKEVGIYKITNTKNDKCYIGQAVNIGDRWAQHVKCSLGIDVAAPNKFYTAMGKDGPEAFTFEILEKCKNEELNAKEAYWIDFYNSTVFGYNTLSGRK